MSMSALSSSAGNCTQHYRVLAASVLSSDCMARSYIFLLTRVILDKHKQEVFHD